MAGVKMTSTFGRGVYVEVKCGRHLTATTACDLKYGHDGLCRSLPLENPVRRANWIGAPEFYELNQACRTITEAFGYHVYLVGSALTSRDHRDVDVRCILPDDEYASLFPGIHTQQRDARWSLLCSAISLWLSKHSGLKIDFQIQQQTAANEEYPGARDALGVFLEPNMSSEKPNASTEHTSEQEAPLEWAPQAHLLAERILAVIMPRTGETGEDREDLMTICGEIVRDQLASRVFFTAAHRKLEAVHKQYQSYQKLAEGSRVDSELICEGLKEALEIL